MKQYVDGDAKWYFTPVPVVEDTQYQFSDFYQANVTTQVVVAFDMKDGSSVYQLLGLPAAGATWTQFSTKFSVPLGAKSMSVYHLINKNGTLTIDDANIRAYTPVGLTRPLVTLTFDDGFVNMFTEVQPLLSKYGFTSTQFIATNFVGQPGYLTRAQLKTLYANGNEIGAHTLTHRDLTKLSAAQVQSELSLSKSRLVQWTGAPVTDFAFPEGLYNDSVLTTTKAQFTASRGIEDGLNGKDDFARYHIKVQNIYASTSAAQVADWVKQAQMTNTWLVLTYHSVDPDIYSVYDSGIYNIVPTLLDQHLSAIKKSGVTVTNMDKALAELIPQLSQ